ncbi:MAG: polymer-forming cytoskeletal protein [Candidatus Methylomirabilis sp.]|nr:polymer-forming cytoskeletal protein [Deltaproteobacteria bacterium]
MFRKEKDRNEKNKTAVAGDITGFIGKGVAMEGRLSFEETMRVDGSFKGDISAPSGALVVGEGAHIEGDIRVGTAVISGTVKGRIEAAQRVELKSPGNMTGEIKTPTLIIEEGVVFDGTCTMLKKDGTARETVEYGEVPQEATIVGGWAGPSS